VLMLGNDFNLCFALCVCARTFTDELSVKGFIGTVEKTFEQVDNHRHDKTRYFLFTHLDFSIAFNQNHVSRCR